MAASLAFAGAVEGWSVNYIIRHAWRTRPEFDVDDLRQEAFLVYRKVIDKYSVKATSEKHLMALYKRSLANRIQNIANRSSVRNRVERAAVIDTAETSVMDAIAAEAGVPCPGAGDVQLTLAVHYMEEGPVKQCLQALLAFDGVLPCMSKRKGRRETTDHYLARIAGIKGKKQARGLTTRVKEILT